MTSLSKLAALTLLISGVALLSGNLCGQNQTPRIEARLLGREGDSVGIVTFRQTMRGDVNIDVKVNALTRGEHGIHIHQYPRCDAPDFKSAGTHFNPDGKQHGRLNSLGPHAGDLPENLIVDENGNGELNVTLRGVNLLPDQPNSLLGRSLVIHEYSDDMKTDPSGRSGNRIACAVIQAK